ncbi:hypothetical protein [Protaetiibacter larvae]|uniref:Uncharacterized protein n=1 Tax=Protaetiibacter larvae TaxID=2592654 RepID=A0A5C1YCT3_9MICO|nr:hypothetical protein [Protaetiibacter larvae]QEO10687.1 hypothetical protein FLP23_12140 [Protaetiibacter larvae]
MSATDGIPEPALDAAATPAQHERRDPSWPVPAIVLAIVFGVLFAWFLYQAIGNLVNVPHAYAAVGMADRVPWVLLIGGIALPVVFYVGAALIGVRQTLANRVLLFAAGLAATSATALALYAASAFLASRA